MLRGCLNWLGRADWATSKFTLHELFRLKVPDSASALAASGHSFGISRCNRFHSSSIAGTPPREELPLSLLIKDDESFGKRSANIRLMRRVLAPDDFFARLQHLIVR